MSNSKELFQIRPPFFPSDIKIKQVRIGEIFGMEVIVDPTLSPGTIQFVGEKQAVTVYNLSEEE